MPFYQKFLLFFMGFILVVPGFSQGLLTKRTSFYALTGTSGAPLNGLNSLLEEQGMDRLSNRYQTIGLGYQNRVNDFILGFELYQHSSDVNRWEGYELGYRTSRALVHLGYSFTEESAFQLIHYLSAGFGFINFQMLSEESPEQLEAFLANPQQGFILRENDIHQGSGKYGDFLTEIGFQLSYDFSLPTREESLLILAKLGYAFSPFEGNWSLNGLSFQNAQSGAFLRVGVGLTIPDRNFFYKDAAYSFQLISGVHFTHAQRLNQQLRNAGLQEMEGQPSNLGIRITGYNEHWRYGMEVFNLALSGEASERYTQSLNSLRVYANVGREFFRYRNWTMGAQSGLGYGALRYSLIRNEKPDFPELLQDPNHDGYLRKGGLMLKPEFFLEFSHSVTKRDFFDLVWTASLGYEQALGNYKLAGEKMSSFMSAPYVSFGLGIRP